MDACATNASRIHVPLLVQGAGDALVSPKGNGQLLAARPCLDKTRLIAPMEATAAAL